MFKCNIRKNTIKYSQAKRKIQKDLEKQLNDSLFKVDNELAKQSTDELMGRREQIYNNIKKLEDDKIRGAAIRARETWFEEGEKSSKYFYNLNKKKPIKLFLRKLQNPNGKIIYNQIEIFKMQKDFYSELYAKRQPDIFGNNENLFLNNNIKPLSLDDQNLCEGPITGSNHLMH